MKFVLPGRDSRLLRIGGVFDPATVEGDEKRMAFAKASAVLERRIALFTSLRPESLERLTLERQVREIGRMGES